MISLRVIITDPSLCCLPRWNGCTKKCYSPTL